MRRAGIILLTLPFAFANTGFNHGAYPGRQRGLHDRTTNLEMLKRTTTDSGLLGGLLESTSTDVSGLIDQ